MKKATSPKPEKDFDSTELLWNLYQEHCAWERHHEEQRATASNILIAVAAGVLGLITYEDGITSKDIALTLFLVGQGLYGTVFVWMHYDRFSMHQKRAGKYRHALDQLHPKIGVLRLRDEADEKYRQDRPLTSKWRLHWFWMALHILIAMCGFVIFMLALCSSTNDLKQPSSTIVKPSSECAVP